MGLLLEFIFACLLMGLAIGLDVAIVTALYSKQFSVKAVKVRWVVGVTATHTLFPMFGYMLSYFGLKWLPSISPMIGLIAFVFIAYFLYQELQDYHEGDEASFTHKAISWALIIAVSWDALWSGPAKSAQIINWPESLVWLSFFVVGGLVLLSSQIGLWLGRYLIASQKDLKVNRGWHWLQYSTIAYFGLLALFRYTFNSQIHDGAIFMLAATLVGSYVFYPVTQNRE